MFIQVTTKKGKENQNIWDISRYFPQTFSKNGDRINGTVIVLRGSNAHINVSEDPNTISKMIEAQNANS